MVKLEQAWRKIDKVHPLDAKFYSDDIEAAYKEYSLMVNIIGILSALAISIASMGLFGMVVFTTETRLKEIGIRKVMGAGVGSLVGLLSRNFILLLGIAATIAIPTTWFLFERIFLPKFPYHEPVGIFELFIGLLGVLIVAFIMIGSQTFVAAQSNPAKVLKNE
jgi:ABC-type antimicrobial peptide transport system permease subunit